MTKKKRAAPACGLYGKDIEKQDPLAYLGDDVLAKILGSLEADDCARCTLVSKLWRDLAASDEIWMKYCVVRGWALTCVHDMPDNIPILTRRDVLTGAHSEHLACKSITPTS